MYNRDIAVKLCRCCQVAFNKDRGHYGLGKDYPDLINVVRLAVTNLEAAVFSFNTYSVLVFHHSDDLLDWQVNLDVMPINGFHGGYYKAVRRLSTLVNKVIGRRPFYITGHSLGGALASIYSLQYLYNSLWLGTYTFASPKVTLPSYQALINKRLEDRLYSLQHSEDLVRHLLPFYQHIGQVYMIDGKNTSLVELLSKDYGKIVRNHQLFTFLNILEQKE
jgi:hypothetical protein